MPQNEKITNTNSNSNYVFPQSSRIDQYNVGERSIIIQSWSKPSLSGKYY